MSRKHLYGRTFGLEIIFLSIATVLGFSQTPQATSNPVRSSKYFDHVLIVVLENQDYVSAMKNDLLKSLAQNGATFSNFVNLYHYSYPNYLAMIAGSDFGKHKFVFTSDNQTDFPNDSEHRTIGDLLNWKNYAEDYPASLADKRPYLDAADKKTPHLYVRRHVPFLSFQEVQRRTFQNVVAVNNHDPKNAFVTDIGNFIADPQRSPLPEYIFFSPNMYDDGHDPKSKPDIGLKQAADWLRNFLITWLHFDDKTWVAKDEALKRTLVIVTFDESEGHTQPEKIYTVFLGNMVKPQEVKAAYNHYSVLRTIEDNFNLGPIHTDSGDGAASVITGIWK